MCVFCLCRSDFVIVCQKWNKHTNYACDIDVACAVAKTVAKPSFLIKFYVTLRYFSVVQVLFFLSFRFHFLTFHPFFFRISFFFSSHLICPLLNHERTKLLWQSTDGIIKDTLLKRRMTLPEKQKKTKKKNCCQLKSGFYRK